MGEFRRQCWCIAFLCAAGCNHAGLFVETFRSAALLDRYILQKRWHQQRSAAFLQQRLAAGVTTPARARLLAPKPGGHERRPGCAVLAWPRAAVLATGPIRDVGGSRN